MGLSDSKGFVESYFVRFLPRAKPRNDSQSSSESTGQSHLKKEASAGVRFPSALAGELICPGEKSIRGEGSQLVSHQLPHTEGYQYTCF